MFRISCFADEICPDLDGQMDFLVANKIRYIELRSVWEKNVLDLSDNELNIIKGRLNTDDIKVSSIGSPIGKVDITEDFGKHLERFERAIYAALKMESKYIRIFSFYINKREAERYEEAVMNRLMHLVDIAIENNIVLLHENEADIYGETSERCQKLMEGIRSPNFKAVFDPSNFVVAGEDVYNQSFKRLKRFIEYVHVKDSSRSTGEIVIAGQGDGNIRQIMSELREREDIFVSLEPHLSFAGRYYGFTGPKLFRKDLEAFRHILDELNISYI